MGKRNPKNFDFDSLHEFLKTPRTAAEIQKHYGIKTRCEAVQFLDMATYYFLIWQTDGRGRKEEIKYGLMEGQK